jgi:hypothetical protein
MQLVAAVCVLRYYTDKWQLLTAHSTLRVDPAPEMTASANHFALLMAAALAQAAFASWLWIQVFTAHFTRFTSRLLTVLALLAVFASWLAVDPGFASQ